MPRKQKRRVSTPEIRARLWPPTRARLEELIAEAILDAYGDAEQRGGLYTMIEDHLALPFVTEVLGVAVTVERIDLTVTDAIVDRGVPALGPGRVIWEMERRQARWNGRGRSQMNRNAWGDRSGLA